MMFSKFLTRSVHLGGGNGGHNSPEDGVLQDFQQVLSLNIDGTQLDLGRSFDSISSKLGRVVVPIENWNCIVFGPNRPNEGGGR